MKNTCISLFTSFIWISEWCSIVCSYEEAIKMLSSAEILAPVYYIVGGSKPGQGAVITRDRTKTDDIMQMNTQKGSSDIYFHILWETTIQLHVVLSRVLWKYLNKNIYASYTMFINIDLIFCSAQYSTLYKAVFFSGLSSSFFHRSMVCSWNKLRQLEESSFLWWSSQTCQKVPLRSWRKGSDFHSLFFLPLFTELIFLN